MATASTLKNMALCLTVICLVCSAVVGGAYALTKDEFADLMKFIRDNKIQAFITAGNVSEVYGLWSEHKRHRV